MNRHKRYPPEVRERAVRLVLEHQENYNSQWAALTSIAGKIGCTAETLENQQIMNTLISFLCRLITKRRPSRAIKKDYPDYAPRLLIAETKNKPVSCTTTGNPITHHTCMIRPGTVFQSSFPTATQNNACSTSTSIQQYSPGPTPG